MKKILIFVFIMIFLSFASAETTIIFNEEPDDVYNMGDVISIPVTVKSTNEIYGTLETDLLCEGEQINFYKNGITLAPGEEKKYKPSVILIKNHISNLKGRCKLKAVLGGEYATTKEFQISDLIKLSIESEESEFLPGEEIIIRGNATKENKKPVNGLINLELIGPESNETRLETIKNDYFTISLQLPEDAKAGKYLLKLDAYEEDLFGAKTNTGFVNHNIDISQVPTTLEILIDEKEIEPGTNAKIKIIVHDQTGENIENKTAVITIKRSENDDIFEQKEINTGEFFEFPIQYYEAPGEFEVHASSGDLKAEADFEVTEKEKIDINLINRTVLIKNMGNVPYCNETVLVKISGNPVNIDTCLEVNESQKYILTAPDGDYDVEILNKGETAFKGSVALTGKSIAAKKVRESFNSLNFAWIFMILVLGFIAIIIFKRKSNKKFSAHMPSPKKEKKPKEERDNKIPSFLTRNSKIKTNNKAELSLSLKGNKQNSSLTCLKIKNLKEIQERRTNAEETLQKVVDMAEKHKAAVYENQEDLFFILAPVQTKTFKNETTAVEIAQKAREILNHHNKLFKQKIEFGISVNQGSIITKQEKDVLKFMSMGTLINSAKKIASIAEDDILISEPIRERLGRKVKAEKIEGKDIKTYKITEIKDTEDHKKFIQNFLKRLEEGKKEK